MSERVDVYKTMRFHEYAKLRTTLKFADTVPPHPQSPATAIYLNMRIRKTVLELLFEDFRPVYERLSAKGHL